MTISELSHEQRIALVALVKAIVMSNGDVTSGELSEIGQIVIKLGGDEEYRSLLNEADERFSDLDDLKIFLRTIEEEEARSVIFGTVWEESVADPNITHEESELIEWVASIWDIPDGVNQGG